MYYKRIAKTTFLPLFNLTDEYFTYSFGRFKIVCISAIMHKVFVKWEHIFFLLTTNRDVH